MHGHNSWGEDEIILKVGFPTETPTECCMVLAPWLTKAFMTDKKGAEFRSRGQERVQCWMPNNWWKIWKVAREGFGAIWSFDQVPHHILLFFILKAHYPEKSRRLLAVATLICIEMSHRTWIGGAVFIVRRQFFPSNGIDRTTMLTLWRWCKGMSRQVHPEEPEILNLCWSAPAVVHFGRQRATNSNCARWRWWLGSVQTFDGSVEQGLAISEPLKVIIDEPVSESSGNSEISLVRQVDSLAR